MCIWEARFVFPKCTFCVCFFLSFFFFLFEPKCLTFFVNSARYVLFMDSQILLFNHFFIKNESYGTIHTFKIYFTTVFLVFSCIQIDPKHCFNHNSPNYKQKQVTKLLAKSLTPFRKYLKHKRYATSLS